MADEYYQQVIKDINALKNEREHKPTPKSLLIPGYISDEDLDRIFARAGLNIKDFVIRRF
jgi:hypothetical protein